MVHIKNFFLFKERNGAPHSLLSLPDRIWHSCPNSKSPISSLLPHSLHSSGHPDLGMSFEPIPSLHLYYLCLSSDSHHGLFRVLWSFPIWPP